MCRAGVLMLGGPASEDTNKVMKDIVEEWVYNNHAQS